MVGCEYLGGSLFTSIAGGLSHATLRDLALADQIVTDAADEVPSFQAVDKIYFVPIAEANALSANS